jgi:hypothetical protein
MSVLSYASELAFANENGNLGCEADIVWEDAGYLARSSPGLLLAIADIGDGVRGVVGGADVVCHLRGLEVVLAGRLAVGEDDMFRITAPHDSYTRFRGPVGTAVAVAVAMEALEGVIAGRLRWRDGDSGSPDGQDKERYHVDEQNLNNS